MIASTTLARAPPSEFGMQRRAELQHLRGVCVSSIRSSCVTNATTRRNASRSRTAWPFTVLAARRRGGAADSTLSSVVFQRRSTP